MKRPKLKVGQSILWMSQRALEADRLVYLIVVPKLLPYKEGKSRIAYIGTTKKGIGRAANSAVWKAEEIFDQHGVREFDVHFVTCRGRRSVQTWRLLESALLYSFRQRYWKLPLCNKKRPRRNAWRDAEQFTTRALEKLLDEFERARSR